VGIVFLIPTSLFSCSHPGNIAENGVRSLVLATLLTKPKDLTPFSGRQRDKHKYGWGGGVFVGIPSHAGNARAAAVSLILLPNQAMLRYKT